MYFRSGCIYVDWQHETPERNRKRPEKYGTVTVDHDMCIVCVVVTLEWENVGFEAKALDAMREIPVRMILFGGSNYNISFLIRESDKKQASAIFEQRAFQW